MFDIMLIGAHVRIEPDFTLQETARILGEALDVSLELDESGYFEEVPTFFGSARDYTFALMGPPEPQYVVGTPDPSYYLAVRPLASDAKPDPALGTEIQHRIAAQGKLRSELPT